MRIVKLLKLIIGFVLLAYAVATGNEHYGYTLSPLRNYDHSQQDSTGSSTNSEPMQNRNLFADGNRRMHNFPYTYSRKKNSRAADSPLGKPITLPSSNFQTSASSYTSPSYTPAYRNEVYYDENSYYDDDYYKKKKLAAGIAVPLAVVLGPLAVIGLLALSSLRSLMVLTIIQSMCSNANFAASFNNICTLINNIGKRSTTKEEIINKLINSETVTKMVNYLHNATYTALDHLNTVNDINKAR